MGYDYFAKTVYKGNKYIDPIELVIYMQKELEYESNIAIQLYL